MDFSDIRYNVRSYSLTAVLLIVSSDRIAVAFNWSGATQAVISKTFNRDWGDGLPLKLKFYRVSGGLVSPILLLYSIRRLIMVLDGKSSQ